MSDAGAPFTRTLKLGVNGEDVIAVKRALSRVGVMEWGRFTPVYGDHARDAVRLLQRQHRIGVDGIYGPVTHRLLDGLHRKAKPSEWAFDRLAVRLMVAEYHLLTDHPGLHIRKTIVAAAAWWYAHRSSIAYSQARPFWLGKPPGVPTRMDCSGFVSVCHYAGGAPNPNRRPWDGLGYTGTLMLGGERCGYRDLELGDLVFYGYTTRPSAAFPYGSPTHVALFDGHGGVYSMGSYPMGHYPVSYRGVNHYRNYDVTR
jgi:hypothetical protein